MLWEFPELQYRNALMMVVEVWMRQVCGRQVLGEVGARDTHIMLFKLPTGDSVCISGFSATLVEAGRIILFMMHTSL